MFFFRSWAQAPTINGRPPPGGPPDIFGHQFANNAWGYGILLGLTILGSLLFNGSFLLTFWTNPHQRRYVPDIAILLIVIRDLLVTCFLFPTLIVWMIVNEGVWNSGIAWCKMSGFFEFTLTAQLPILLIAFCVILMSRRLPKIDDLYFDEPMGPIDEFINDNQLGPTSNVPGVIVVSPPSIPGSKNPSRAPSVISGSISGSVIRGGSVNRTPGRPGSVDGFAHGGGNRGKRLVPGGMRRPESVTGSIEGRLAVPGRRPGHSQEGSVRSSSGGGSSRLHAPHPSSHFRASSPLHEVDETSIDGDLWDAASLDYPGREFETFSQPGDGTGSPDAFGPPTFHGWHYWLLGFTWIVALAIGIPGTIFIQHFPRMIIPAKNSNFKKH